MTACRSRLSAVVIGQPVAAPAGARVWMAGRPVDDTRVPNVGSSSARVSAWGAAESAMTASAPSQASAASAALALGTMPPAIVAVGDERLGLGRGQRVELAAVGAAHAVGIGQQDQLSGSQPCRDARGGIVGVDVAHDAVLVARQRGDDRDLVGDEERVEQVALEADDMRDEPDVRDPLAHEHPAIMPLRPTASTPRSRSAETSSEFTTPRRTAAATSSAAASVTRSPPSNRLSTPSRASHSVMRLPPPWTTTTGRPGRRSPRPRGHAPGPRAWCRRASPRRSQTRFDPPRVTSCTRSSRGRIPP